MVIDRKLHNLKRINSKRKEKDEDALYGTASHQATVTAYSARFLQMNAFRFRYLHPNTLSFVHEFISKSKFEVWEASHRAINSRRNNGRSFKHGKKKTPNQHRYVVAACKSQTVRRNPRTSTRKLCRFFLNFWWFSRSSVVERLLEVVRAWKAFVSRDLNVGLLCLSINSLANACKKYSSQAYKD